MVKKKKITRGARAVEFVTPKEAEQAPITDPEMFFRPDPKIVRKKKDKKWSRGR